MKAYVIVQGMTVVAVVRAVVPPELLAEAALTPADERAIPISMARTLVATRRKPLAMLINTDSVAERIIQEQVQGARELLQMAAGRIPTRVIPLIPSVEAVFFMAEGLLERVLCQPLSEEMRLLGRSSPKEALELLFARSSGPKTIPALLDGLDDEGVAALRATPPFRELIAFLEGVVNPQPEPSLP